VIIYTDQAERIGPIEQHTTDYCGRINVAGRTQRVVQKPVIIKMWYKL